MQKLYVNEIVIRVNSLILQEFYTTCEHLHKVHKKNCFYDHSAPFKFIIKEFCNDFEDVNENWYWTKEIETYNSKMKKDARVGFWITNYYYKKLMRYCAELEINRVKVVRSLMLKLIEENRVGDSD